MLNGTLKDSEICHNCGEAVRSRCRQLPTHVITAFTIRASFVVEQGHRIWNCPKREKWKPTEIAIPKEAQAAVRCMCSNSATLWSSV